MICQNCGTENRPDVRFCRNCGHSLAPAPPVSSPTLMPPAASPAPLPPAASPMPLPPTASPMLLSPAASPSPMPPASSPVENPLKLSSTAVLPADWRAGLVEDAPPSCPHCGMTVKLGARFCAHCGKPLPSAPVDASPLPASNAPYPAVQPSAAPREALTPVLYPPLSPQVLASQPLVGEYPSAALPVAPASGLRGAQPPPARPRQLPGWLIWLLLGVALIAILGVVGLLISAAPRLLNVMRATATPTPTVTSQPSATPPPTATLTAVLSEEPVADSPVSLELTTATATVSVGQSGILTLTLLNHTPSAIQPQRLEILGTSAPTLAFTPSAQMDVDAGIVVGVEEVWTATFAFDALQPGEATVIISVKFTRSDTQQVDISFSDEIKIQVVNPTQ